MAAKLQLNYYYYYYYYYYYGQGVKIQLCMSKIVSQSRHFPQGKFHGDTKQINLFFFSAKKKSKTKSLFPLQNTRNLLSSVCNISTMTCLNLLKYYQFLASVFIGYFRFKSKFAVSGLYLPVNMLCFKPPFVTLK